MITQTLRSSKLVSFRPSKVTQTLSTSQLASSKPSMLIFSLESYSSVFLGPSLPPIPGVNVLSTVCRQPWAVVEMACVGRISPHGPIHRIQNSRDPCPQVMAFV